MPTTVLVVDYSEETAYRLTQEEGIDVVGGAHLVRHMWSGEYDPDIVGVLGLIQYADYVVVGNNRRSGVRVVEVFPLELRARTAVVWHETPTAADEAQYRELGIPWFGTRAEVVDLVRAMIDEFARAEARRDRRTDYSC